jgi:uncharacterized protein YecT (DUF1311 family)
MTHSQANKAARRLAEYYMSQPGVIEEARRLQGHCDQTENQAFMNACWKLESEDSNEHMNALFKTLLGKLDARQTATLHKIQGAWVHYRDLQCNGTAAEYEGGSMQPAVFYSCRATLTSARIRDMKSSYATEVETFESDLK